MNELHPDVARFAAVLLELERHLAANGDTDRATEVSRCRAAADNSDGRSVDAFLSLFGFMGDFASAGLPPVTGDYETVNRRFEDLTSEALALARMFQHERVQARLEAEGRAGGAGLEPDPGDEG
jgi:hypothetical protein